MSFPALLVELVETGRSLVHAPMPGSRQARPAGRGDCLHIASTNREPFLSQRVSTSVSTDSDLIRASFADPSAFGDLYRRHAARLHRYAARRTDQAVADDVTSETFLVAFERRDRFDHAWDNAAPWLFGIATQLIHRHRRTEVRMLRSLRKAADPETAPDEVGRAGELEDARAIVAALAHRLKRMPAGDRDCLLLYAWGDLSYAEIALALDVPVGTVRSRLNRARRVLGNAPELEEVNHGRTDFAPSPTQ